MDINDYYLRKGTFIGLWGSTSSPIKYGVILFDKPLLYVTNKLDARRARQYYGDFFKYEHEANFNARIYLSGVLPHLNYKHPNLFIDTRTEIPYILIDYREKFLDYKATVDKEEYEMRYAEVLLKCR